MDGISNLAWINGGDELASYIMDLVEAFCGNGVLPAEISLSYMSSLDKKPEAQVDGHNPAIVFRHPLDTRPPSPKQADNKQVAKVLNYCIIPVVEKCAIDTQRGFIRGRQLAQIQKPSESVQAQKNRFCHHRS